MSGMESGQGNKRPCATADRDSVMDDSVEGPSTTRKQKIKDGEPEEMEWCNYFQKFCFS